MAQFTSKPTYIYARMAAGVSNVAMVTLVTRITSLLSLLWLRDVLCSADISCFVI
jgi:hypothetical protein